ncbi:MAG: hypothetical protein DDT20_00046 [Firmicutes bacterium]|nr:hypothetical protein [Bacillota bacterium]
MRSPEQHLGFPVGADRSLADWEQITGYFRVLSESSPRCRVTEIGRSTEGRPFLLVVITSSENHARLEQIEQVQRELADPRGKQDNQLAELMALGKTVVLMTNSIHATEVGPTQMSLELAYELVTACDEETMESLDNTVLLLVPCANPDGLDLVVDWYRQTLGTAYEGTAPPQLYHRYAGHDNNRDWFMFTQQETRLMVEHIHNTWHPQIVLDFHQQGQDGPRIVLPPFVDPYDPNVDPLIRQGAAWLGQTIAAELSAHGKTGVMTNVTYDAYSPSRSYQHYHGGVRILAEVASARLATPVTLDEQHLRGGRGYDPRIATWNQPEPWRGGEWRLRDIVEYCKLAALACLRHAAKYRRLWLKNFVAIGQRATAPKPYTYAFVLPPKQRDPRVAAELIELLMFGGVEIHAALLPFSADGVDYTAGNYVVLMQQPYSSFAKTLLENQSYPDVRRFSDGFLRQPYDMAAHSLPIQMGVTVTEIRAPFKASLARIKQPPRFVPNPPAVSLHGRWLYIRPEPNGMYTALARFLAAEVPVHRLKHDCEDPELPPGTLIVSGEARELVMELAADLGLSVGTLPGTDLPSVTTLTQVPRVGVYQGYVPNPDEGFMRFVLEQHAIPYATLKDQDIRAGGLAERFDVVVIPSARAKTISEGLMPGVYPREYCGGLGMAGAQALREFALGGGTVVGVDHACDWCIEALRLKVTNVVGSAREDEFLVPGSFLRVAFDISHPLAYGMPQAAAVVFVRSPVFSADETAKAVGRYPAVNPLVCGLLHGAERLSGRAALLECTVKKGRVVLIGFRPHHRAQSRGTYKVLFNALFR